MILDTLRLCENGGLHYAVLSNDSIGQRLIAGDSYEAWVWDVMQPCLDSSMCFIDAGAYIGCFTVRAASHVKRVHAFEPLDTSRTLLEINVRMNGLSNVMIYNKALGNPDPEDRDSQWDEIIAHESRTDMANINVGGASRLRKVRDGRSTWGNRVRVVSLDAYEFTDIAAMKVDIQESELPFLQGAEKTIERERPPLFIELVEWDKAQRPTMEWLESYGYELHQLRGFDWVAIHPDNRRGLKL